MWCQCYTDEDGQLVACALCTTEVYVEVEPEISLETLKERLNHLIVEVDTRRGEDEIW